MDCAGGVVAAEPPRRAAAVFSAAYDELWRSRNGLSNKKTGLLAEARFRHLFFAPGDYGAIRSIPPM
jgi:hypothetical protein